MPYQIPIPLPPMFLESSILDNPRGREKAGTDEMFVPSFLPALKCHAMVKADLEQMQKCVWTRAVCKHGLLAGSKKAFQVDREEKDFPKMTLFLLPHCDTEKNFGK